MNVRYTIACSYNMSKQIKTHTCAPDIRKGAAIHPIWTVRIYTFRKWRHPTNTTNKFSLYPIRFEGQIVICSCTPYIFIYVQKDINGERKELTIIIYKQTNDEFLFDPDFSIIIAMVFLSIFLCEIYACVRGKKGKEERK